MTAILVAMFSAFLLLTFDADKKHLHKVLFFPFAGLQFITLVALLGIIFRARVFGICIIIFVLLSVMLATLLCVAYFIYPNCVKSILRTKGREAENDAAGKDFQKKMRNASPEEAIDILFENQTDTEM
jgi:hypothetical protein